jgi:hypothetical protein
VLLRAVFGTAGWPNGPGEGSTGSVSPAPLTCFLVQGGRWFVQSRKLPEWAMRLLGGIRVLSTCSPLTSGIPCEMQRTVISQLYRLYTREGAKLSSSRSTFFIFGFSFASMGRRGAFSGFSFQTLLDEDNSDFCFHLIDSRARSPCPSTNLGNRH